MILDSSHRFTLSSVLIAPVMEVQGRVGNLICCVHVVMPKNLTDKDIKALEKLSKSSSFKVNG